MGCNKSLGNSAVGMQFGVFKIVNFVGQNNNGASIFLTRCSNCGNEREMLYANIKRNIGNGCIKCAKGAIKHGLKHSRIYGIWCKMKERCYNQSVNAYKNYGGRGICVCNEWLDDKTGFIDFNDWALHNGYDEKLTIDRIDVNGNYEPLNCRFVDRFVQANNKRNNNNIEINGTVKTLQQWCNQYNISHTTVLARVRTGWPIEKALSLPKYARLKTN